MCGRTACSLDKDCIIKASAYRTSSGVEQRFPEWRDLNSNASYWPRYNLSPTHHLPVLMSKAHLGDEYAEEERAIVPMRWGLVPQYHKGELSSFKLATINCRSEGLTTSRIFKTPFEKGQRCVLLCEGYFEWVGSGKQKKPYFFYFPQESVDFKSRGWSGAELLEKKEWQGPRLLTVAAIFEVNKHVSDEPLYTFTILTTTSDKKLSWVHDRMPVILKSEEDVAKWLQYKSFKENDVLDLIRPYDGLQFHEVSTKVGNVRNDGIECVLPPPTTTAKVADTKQGTLDQWFKKRPAVDEINEEKVPIKKKA